ncbi:hypothetical protein TNCT_274931 [Trichonephila clavata]|uniref:Uncharacterized protein n=1 Tax=Trichonephila clavata TaxID=2740835 RepID=A0A8X6KFW3_TRICU|nr:hypothetical protein TNCT_274931 [Trichonephila clavata]
MLWHRAPPQVIALTRNETPRISVPPFFYIEISKTSIILPCPFAFYFASRHREARMYPTDTRTKDYRPLSTLRFSMKSSFLFLSGNLQTKCKSIFSPILPIQEEKSGYYFFRKQII